MEASYNLFLSYNTRDRESVLRVQEALRTRGIATFLDCQHLVPGLNWRDEIEAALTKATSVAIFIGSEGFGRVQRNEKNMALDRQDAATQAGRKFPVIPILLPGANPEAVTGFLSQNTWIDLRNGLDKAVAIDAIVRAVKGEAPATTTTPPEPLCPYRGLLAFTEDDAPLFYGRDAFADYLLQKARIHKLIAVVGPSGTGKSSVVQAGLLPRLRRERAPNAQWEAIIFRPGNRPFHNLANELVVLYETEPSKTKQILVANDLGDALANNKLPLDVPIAEALKTAKWANRLLIIADQFEELFTLTEEKDRKPFVNLLLKAAETAPLTIVLTLRGDFYNQAISVSRELSDLMQQGIVNIGYVKREELRRAILEPAKTVGLQFEDGLVDRILDNLEDEPGNLPLLEFALTELWEKRQGNRVTNQLYEEIGGVAGSVGKRAEEVFTGLSATQQNIALRAFTRLVRVSAASEEGADTRQRVTLKEFNDAAVLQPFVKARLLVTSRNETTGEEIVEVAHEALIKNWERLKVLVRIYREFLLWRQEFNFLRAKWLRTQSETGNERDGLLIGNDLVKAKDWLRSNTDDLNEGEKSFIRKSEDAAKRPKKWITVASAVLLLMVLFGWGWKIWDDRPASQIYRIIAESRSLVLIADQNNRNHWLKNLAITGRFNEVLTVAKSIEGKERTNALMNIAEALAQAGQTEESLAVAKCIEDVNWRSEALATVAKTLAQAGQIEKAVTLAKSIEAVSYRSLAWAEIAKALAQARQTEESLAVAKSIEDISWRSSALAAVAPSLAQAGQTEESLAVAKSIEDISWRSHALMNIAKALAQAGQTEDAFTVAKNIEDVSNRSLALAKVAEALAQIGQKETAKLAAQEALIVARSIEDDFKGSIARANVAEALAQIGQKETAKLAVQEALTVAKSPENVFMGSFALATVAEALAQAGQTGESLTLAMSIKDISRRSRALATVAQTLAQAGQTKELLTGIKSIEDIGARSLALAKVAEALAQIGQKETAKLAAQEALIVARSIEDAGNRSNSLTKVARTLARAGEVEAAKTAIDETLLLIPKLRDNDKSQAYSIIAQALAKLHDYRLAREMALNCSSSDSKLSVYTAILREYAIDQEKISPKLFEHLDREE